MKTKMIALLLSIVLASGSIGAVPVLAAEPVVQESVPEQEEGSGENTAPEQEEESGESTAPEEEEGSGDDTAPEQEEGSGDDTAPEQEDGSEDNEDTEEGTGAGDSSNREDVPAEKTEPALTDVDGSEEQGDQRSADDEEEAKGQGTADDSAASDDASVDEEETTAGEEETVAPSDVVDTPSEAEENEETDLTEEELETEDGELPGASGQGDYESEKILFNGHYYYFRNCSMQSAFTFEMAENWCEEEGGHLVTINSPEEETFIRSQMSKIDVLYGFWIGAYRDNKNESWKWINGEEWNYPGTNGNGTNNWTSNAIRIAYFPNSTGVLCFSTPDDVSGFICEWEDDSAVGVLSIDTEFSCAVNRQITISAKYTGKHAISEVSIDTDAGEALEFDEPVITPIVTGDSKEYDISFNVTGKTVGEYSLTLTADDGTNASVLVKVTGIGYELKDGILTLYRWDEDIPDFTTPEDAPWYEDREQITRVVVDEKGGKVSKIDNYAFQNCPSLRSVLLQSSVPEIRDHAFTGGVVTIYQKAALGKGPSSIVNLDGVTGWIIWEYGTEYNLMISGTGKMEDMTPETAVIAPWAQEKGGNKAYEVTIGGQITRVGNNTFLSTEDITAATISENVREIGSHIVPETENFETSDNNTEPNRINIRFCGNAPGIEEDAFSRAKILAYVPPFDETWTEDRMLDYQGKVSWGKIEWDYENSDFDVPKGGVEDYVKGTKLVISGTGDIPDYYGYNELPWMSRDSEIAEIEIQDGVTGIGSYAFHMIPYVSRISIGKDVKRVGSRAFSITSHKSITGNYGGNAQIIFSGNAPEDFAEDAFGEENDEVDKDGFRFYYPFDIYHLNDFGWDQLESKAWTNHFLSWIQGEPAHILNRFEKWAIDGRIPHNGSEGQFGKASDGYYLSSDDLNKLLSGLNWKEKEAIRQNGKIYRYNLDGNSKKEFKESGGSCRGFAVSEGLLYGSIISPGFITKPLGSFEKNHPSERTKSFINFYHLQQYLPAVVKYMADFQSMNQSDQLSELETLVRQAESEHEMVEISFGVPKAEGELCHTVMGYALEEGLFHVPFDGSDHIFDHRVLTYDPATYYQASGTIVFDQIAGFNHHTSALYYTTDPALETHGLWTIPYMYMVHPVSQTNKIERSNPLNNGKLVSVGSRATYLNAIDYETGTNNFKYGLSYEIMSTTEQNFDVVAEDGTVYSIRDGELKGNDSAVVVGTLNGAVESDEIRIVFREQINSCTVRTDSGGCFSFYSENNDALSLAVIESAGEILFDRQGGVSVTTDNPGKVIAEVTKDNVKNANGESLFPKHTQRIELENVKEVSALFVEEGLIVSADCSTGINCTSEDVATEETVEVNYNISQKPLLLRSSDLYTDTLVIMEDADNDGVFDTVAASSDIIEPDDPDDPLVACGRLTESMVWKYSRSSTLTIEGTGAMPDYTFSNTSPWSSYEVKKALIKKGVTSIGDLAFFGSGNLTSVTIPDSVKSIGAYAFAKCTGLASVTIPKSMISIGDHALQECSSLKSVTIPNSVKNIGDHAFLGCRGLASVTIPNSVTSILNGTFNECSSLKSVTIPESVTSIGEWAFGNCTGLASVTIPKSVTSIKFSTFSGCSGLTSVLIPKGVESIGAYAFNRCSSLASVTIPESVTTIENYAFDDCIGLTDIYYNGSKKGWDAITIGYKNTAFTKAALHLSLSRATVSGVTSKTYTGNAIRQTPAVTLGGQILVEGIDYTVTYSNNTNIGTAKVTFTGIGDYEGKTEKSFKIIPKKITPTVTLSKTSVVYTGKAQKPKVTVKDGKTTLKNGTDYTISYKNNINAGTASIVITGKSNYTGTVTKTFAIKKAANSITASNFTHSYSAKAQFFNLGAKATSGTLKYKSNKTKVKVTSAGRVKLPAKFTGTVKITITAGNKNYQTATKTITITVPSKTKLSSATSPSAGKMKVKWKKNTKVNGYQVQYCLKSSFKGAKKVTIKKNKTTSKKIKGLKKGKKYYVRIRSFKIANGKKYYSAWSAKKTVTIKK